MRTYHFTELGEEIAGRSGLENMTLRVVQDCFLDDITEDFSEYPFYKVDLQDDEAVEKERISSAWRSLKDDDEKREFIAGIDPNKIDGWRRLVSPSSQSLLNIPEAEKYDDTAAEDGPVLSGLIGLQYLGQKSNCRLLDRSQFREFGFNNFIDAASFVGAYVLTQASVAENHRLRFSEEPSFEINEGDLSRKLIVSGDLNGDFRLSETTALEKPALAPNGKFVNFSPEQNVKIAAYHSTEPSIVTAMMKSVFVNRGKAGLETLLSEFYKEMSSFANEAPEKGNKLFMTGFADYGTGDVSFMLRDVRYLLEREDFARKRRLDSRVYSESYLPQSTTHFEILRSDDDLIFQNRNLPNDEVIAQVKLPREHFADFFKALLQQCQAGLGRTSPAQLHELVQGVERLL